jgi:NAD(P)H-dependent FMN reductase
MHFAVIYGSVRTQRKGIRAARWATNALRARNHEVTLVDPKERKLPMLDLMYKEFEPGHAPNVMENLATLFRKVDGFVIVSGEYNHGLPPALKNLLDHFQREYFWRPAALLTYSAGHTGGARAQIALRATLGELGMVTIPSTLDIPRIADALGTDGGERSEHLERARDRYFLELEWYAEALSRARDHGVPYADPREVDA